MPAVVSAPSHNELIVQAFYASRLSLRWVHWRLGLLEHAIKKLDPLQGNAKNIRLTVLRKNFARDIAALSDKLLTNQNPLSADFRQALQKVLQLIRRNIYEKGLIVDEGTAGRCDPELWGGGAPFAAVTPGGPEPRISVCTSWFSMNTDLHRDVITHEFFHLIGLIDHPLIANTADALNDANTMAQLVAYIHDRNRWEDSSGLAKPTHAYPAP